jgi:hypothetical protein
MTGGIMESAEQKGLAGGTVAAVAVIVVRQDDMCGHSTRVSVDART